MKKTKRRAKYLLLLLILFISVGYAILQSNLTINGTAHMNNPTWDIHWNNVQVTNGSVTGTNVTSPATIDSAKTTVSYSIKLPKPGDFYEFTVDAVNSGTIDGMIDTISSKLNGTEISNLPDYLNYSVTYSDGVVIQANQELKAGISEKYKVRIEFKKDITNTQLPESIQTLNLSFTVTYKQATETSQEVEHSKIVYTANIYDKNQETMNAGTNDSVVWLGREIQNGITQYNSAAEAMAALKIASGNINLPFYIKNIIQNGIVVESYLEFVVTPEMASANPGMTAGTYSLRGLNTTTFDYTINDYKCDSKYENGEGVCVSPYYISNRETLLNAFGNTICGGGTYNIDCAVPGLYVLAYANGFVRAYTENWICAVNTNGSSACSYGY